MKRQSEIFYPKLKKSKQFYLKKNHQPSCSMRKANQIKPVKVVAILIFAIFSFFCLLYGK